MSKVPPIGGIYRIRNRNTGEVYIGSTKNLRQRIMAHISNLRSNRHENKHLQQAWHTFGLKGLAFSILEITDRNDQALIDAEQRWMETLRSTVPRFYNRGSAVVGRRLGARHEMSCECWRCRVSRSERNKCRPPKKRPEQQP